jgi:excisionase family DNA binding protein
MMRNQRKKEAAMYYTAEEVARTLHVTRRTVYEWLRSGRLRGVRAGRGWRIRSEDLDAFLKVAAPEAPSANGQGLAVESEGEVERPLTIHEILALSPEEQRKRNQAAIELLQSWLDEEKEKDTEEDGEGTHEEFLRALDKDRLSYRKLFPWLE